METEAQVRWLAQGHTTSCRWNSSPDSLDSNPRLTTLICSTKQDLYHQQPGTVVCHWLREGSHWRPRRIWTSVQRGLRTEREPNGEGRVLAWRKPGRKVKRGDLDATSSGAQCCLCLEYCSPFLQPTQRWRGPSSAFNPKEPPPSVVLCVVPWGFWVPDVRMRKWIRMDYILSGHFCVPFIGLLFRGLN